LPDELVIACARVASPWSVEIKLSNFSGTEIRTARLDWFLVLYQ
jgi:hypothetical protein